MAIDYEDERYEGETTEGKETLPEGELTYSSMIEKSKDFYEEQKGAIGEWTQKQQQMQQERTDFAVEQIQQQKDQAKKDYIKEQSGAYTDWKQQSAQHGTAAEQMAGAGMIGSGFSESSQVAMYNTYQNRVAVARESFNQAVIAYDNAIKDARLQGNAAMAEIAFQGFQKQMELAIEGFQYENQLMLLMLEQGQKTPKLSYGGNNAGNQKKATVPAGSTGKYDRVAFSGDTGGITADIDYYGTYEDGGPMGLLGVGQVWDTGEITEINGEEIDIRVDEKGNEYYWDKNKKMYVLLSKNGG